MKKIYKTFLMYSFIGLVFICIIYSDDFKKACIEAILISGNSIIPSLFPALSIITIMIESGLIFSVSRKILPFLFFLLSQVSGYPTGSKILNIAVKNEIIKKNDAQKLLLSMVCSGPAFVITFIGSNLFNSKEIGIRIYISLFLANLIIFIITGGFLTKIKEVYIKTELKSSFLSSVLLSAESVIKISVIFMFFYTFIKGTSALFSEKFNLIIASVFEVTGCAVLSKNIYLTCAALSWGGICVHLQIKNFAQLYSLNYIKFAFWRIVSSLFSCLILRLSMIIIPMADNVISNISNSVSVTFGGNIGFVIVLSFSVFVLLLSISKNKNPSFI